jgi:hypothetical protein
MMKKIFIIISFVLWFSLLGYSHGLKLKVEKKSPCILVTTIYHGGIAVGDAEIKVFFNDVQVVFQKGNADKKGNFSFIPDKAGDWYFQADDGMGHKKKIKIEVDAGFFKQVTSAQSADLSRNRQVEVQNQPDAAAGPVKTRDSADYIYCKIMLGVVLIFAFTFILYAYKRKKERSGIE